MKLHLSTYAFVGLLSFAITGCGPAQDQFDIGNPSTGNKKNGDTKADESTTKLTADRLANTRLMLEQMSHASATMALLSNQPKSLPDAPDCMTYEFWPNENPFLVVNYADCEAKAQIGGQKVSMRFSGREEYSKTTSFLAQGTLTLTVSNSAKQTTETYQLDRSLKMKTLTTLASGLSRVQFSQTHTLKSTDSTSSAHDAYTSTISGQAQIETKKVNEGTPASRVKTVFKDGLAWTHNYQTTTWVPVLKQYRTASGSLRLTPENDFALAGPCSMPKGKFGWKLSENNKAYPVGQIETDENEIRDPNGKDPGLKKPQPWGNCRHSPVLF